MIPFIDRVRPLLDLREQVVSFEPQPVITEDNLVVNIDTVIYFQVTDPKAATYEIANPVNAIDLLTVTTLRNVIGGMTLEQTLTSRETINDQLRGILDDATGKWGIRVHRVELKAVDPPPSIKDTMEKQMRADREKRAAILQAEGIKQAAILTAEGEKQSAILKAEGQKQAAILAAEGQSKAIETVFKAIHEGNPDPQLLAYQYLQVLPQIAQGDANKVWVIPSELTQALGGLPTGCSLRRGKLGYNVRAHAADRVGSCPRRSASSTSSSSSPPWSWPRSSRATSPAPGGRCTTRTSGSLRLPALVMLAAYAAKAWGWQRLFRHGRASGGAHARRRGRRRVGRRARASRPVRRGDPGRGRPALPAPRARASARSRSRSSCSVCSTARR